MSRRGLALAVLVLLPQVVLILVASYFYASLNNTLTNNGRWRSAKVNLEKGVMGAVSYTNSRHTLSGNQLNLGRWHGYQEVLFRESLPLKEVAFEFMLAENTYLDFIFGKEDRCFAGVRLGVHPQFENLVYSALHTGEFTSTTSLHTMEIRPGMWLSLKITFKEEAYVLYLEGQEVGTYTASLPRKQLFGFRGCEGEVWVDDIQICCLDPAPTLSESFFNHHHYWPALLAGLFAVLMVNGVARIYLRRAGRSTRRLMFGLFTLLLGLLLISTLGTSFYYLFLSATYPTPDLEEERAWRESHAEEVAKEICTLYSETAEEGIMRVLFIGTSQTWGAGASGDDETFVHVIEKLLNQEKRAFECVNTGLSGHTSPQIFELYAKHWLQLRPAIVVINLSTNDNDAGKFKTALESFIKTNRANGIKTILALEANSIERRPNGAPLHSTMRSVGESQEVTVVDVHAYVASQKHRGMIWWDFVHPTSFGHQLIAECLTPEILKRVEMR
jgi:lysophospholipase L1-like esterase